MGTNYYLHHPQETCPCCGQVVHNPLHLGKSSGRWAFTFQGNRDSERGMVITTFEEWFRRAAQLLSEGWVLKDEYQEIYDLTSLVGEIEQSLVWMRLMPEPHGEFWVDRNDYVFCGRPFS